MSLSFEWDGAKARVNVGKHGVSFEEAATAFDDPFSLTIGDPEHSGEEERFILMGTTYQERLVVVVHTERGDNIRIINARFATKPERGAYEER